MSTTHQNAAPAPTAEQVAKGNEKSGRKRSVRPEDASEYRVLSSGVLKRKTPACTNCRRERYPCDRNHSTGRPCTLCTERQWECVPHEGGKRRKKSHGAETGEHAEPAEPSERDEQPYGQGLEQQYEHRYEQPIGQQPHEQQSDNPYLQPYQGPYQQPYEQPYEQQYQQPYEQPLQPAPQQPYEQPASYSEPPLPQTGTEPALPQSGTDAERRCEFLEARVWHLERDKEETDARMAQMAEDGAAADRRIARFQDLFESMQATIADLQSEHFRLKRQVEGFLRP